MHAFLWPLLICMGLLTTSPATHASEYTQLNSLLMQFMIGTAKKAEQAPQVIHAPNPGTAKRNTPSTHVNYVWRYDDDDPFNDDWYVFRQLRELQRDSEE